MTSASQNGRALSRKGPKTARGKYHSSRNALRHGLSIPVSRDQNFENEIGRVTRAIIGLEETFEMAKFARPVAIALVELKRLRQVEFDNVSNNTKMSPQLRCNRNQRESKPNFSRYVVRAYGRLRSSVKRLDRAQEEYFTTSTRPPELGTKSRKNFHISSKDGRGQ